MTKRLLPLLALVCFGCSSAPEDDGNAGPTDTGVSTDTGVEPDLGPPDLGFIVADLGPPDLGVEDMGFEPMPVDIRAMPSTAELQIGDTVQLLVEARLDTGVRVDATADASFGSLASAVAEVDAAGLVTAVGPGNAIITVSLPGVPSTTVRINVVAEEVGFYLFREELRNGAQIEVADTPGGQPSATATIDDQDGFAGTTSIRIEVPSSPDPDDEGDVSLVLPQPSDLSAYNALEFAIRTEQNNVPTVVEMITSDGSVQSAEFPVIRDWQRFVIPLVNTPVLTDVDVALRLRAQATDVVVRLDEIRYLELETLPSVAFELVPSRDLTVALAPDDTFTIEGVANITSASPEFALQSSFSSTFFDEFESTESAVASVDGTGLVTAVDEGVAQIVGTIDGVDSAPLSLEVVVPATPPNVPAPTPTFPAADVISLYSDAYMDVPRSELDTPTDSATPGELTVMGDNVFYFDFDPAAADFLGELTFEPPANLDLADFTTLRFDLWVGNVSSFEVLVADAGPNGVLDRTTPDDSFSFILFDGTTTPPVVKNQWMSFAVPLDDFMLAKRDDVQALVWFPDIAERIHLDNIIITK